MSAARPVNADLWGRIEAFAIASLHGEVVESQLAEFEQLLRESEEAQDLYVELVEMLVLLPRALTGIGGRKDDDEIPPIVIDASSTIHYPLFTIHSSLGGWLFSYAAATVLMGAAILGAWMYKVSLDSSTGILPVPVAAIDQPPSPPGTPKPEYVGRITGIADCRWMDSGTPPATTVPLGGRYALRSGLLEITYTTGAKVVLEGPCTYEVESPAGGFLALGKLTARVDRSEVRGQSPFPSPLSPLPSPLFSVRTPTAIVTDLGTEFGVEVGKEGNTVSHVFRGAVQVQVAGDPGRQKGAVLRENESVRVERSEGGGGPRLVCRRVRANPASFRRTLFELPKLLDVLDIVAGNDGRGCERERGIDPTTGMEDTFFVPRSGIGEGRKFSPVHWRYNFIDCVFVPDGRTAAPIDTAGHCFQGFPRTCGCAFGSIWARSVDIAREAKQHSGDDGYAQRYWVYAIGRCEQFMPEKRGLLCINSDAGITFNLEAMRRAYPGVAPSRFRAVAGLGDATRVDPKLNGLADYWVLVDGRLKVGREKLRTGDRAVNLDVELEPGDRFLTLAVTDAGRNTRGGGFVVFGDPVLELAVAKPESRKEGRPMNE